jgi:ABC-type Fe3+ transport system permease subunit
MEHQISAARWPLLLAGSVLLVAITVGAPLVVFEALQRTVGGSTATLAALATAIGMVIAVAVAWVVIRTRREAEGL